MKQQSVVTLESVVRGATPPSSLVSSSTFNLILCADIVNLKFSSA